MGSQPTADQVNAALDFYAATAVEDRGPLLREQTAPPAPSATVDLRTEQYRHECEVRYVRAMAPAQRESFLKLVGEKRGEEAAERIRGDLREPRHADQA